jgi:hypothetical protein
MSKNSVARTISFTTFPKIMLQNQWFKNLSKHNVAKTNGYKTFPKQMLLEPWVIQHFQHGDY